MGAALALGPERQRIVRLVANPDELTQQPQTETLALMRSDLAIDGLELRTIYGRNALLATDTELSRFRNHAVQCGAFNCRTREPAVQVALDR